MAGDALTFRVAFVVRWLLWVVRFVVIWPLATMALMALFVLCCLLYTSPSPRDS